ncbi:unnamed protein product [Hapterophycus canaliculatus]
MRLLEAKREMLDMVEVLHQAEEVDDEQLVYLQNLVLVSNEAVASSFGVYEEDQDPVRLAESLKQLCGAQANASRRAAAAAASESDNDDTNPSKMEAKRDAMKATVMKIAINLNNEGLLRAREASVLKEMVLRGNPVLLAAFELYREDGNAAELYDTVARAARCEAKRVAGPPRAKREGAERTDQAISNSSLLELAPQTSGVVVATASGAEDAATRGDTADGEGAGGEVGGVAALTEFQRLVATAVQKGVMDMSDAGVVFSAFESGLNGESGRLQELVHAAWGVYVSGGGEEDALDSLARIVQLAVKPFRLRRAAPADGGTSSPLSTLTTGRSASTSTAELRESMSTAVKAIATQSAQLLLQSNKASTLRNALSHT